MKRSLAVIAVLAVCLLLVQSALPSAFNGLIKGAVVSAVDADNITVETHKSPPLLMLLGRFDSVSVSAAGLQCGKIKFASFDAELKNIHVDIGDVLLNHKLSVDSVDFASLRAVALEQDLAAALNKSLHNMAGCTVRILPQGIKVGGQFNVGGLISTEVEIDGSMVAENNAIIFRTEKFSVAQGAIGRLGGSLTTDIVMVDLNNMPFNVRVKNIILQDGFAEIYADSER